MKNVRISGVGAERAANDAKISRSVEKPRSGVPNAIPAERNVDALLHVIRVLFYGIFRRNGR